ncbi:MAG TPA: carbamoyltransferase HypF, partial [Gemmatimonadaceae bacterium]
MSRSVRSRVSVDAASRSRASRTEHGLSLATMRADTQRVRIRVRGVVQGVGFRPYVYRLAQSLGLGGVVFNDATGVTIEIEGAASAMDAFSRRLPLELPPLARCDGIECHAIGLEGESAFRIIAQRGEHAGQVDAFSLIAPDTTSCDDCVRELLDATNRRYRYPFINCTNCGPRFTIVRSIPYDRVNTTMHEFTMCAWCAAEYSDPNNRRFHAQPNACPVCGPSVRLVSNRGEAIPRAAGDERDDVARTAGVLTSGGIIAIKGIGGYHLACLAADEQAVARLRERKHRPDKPFAIMVVDAEAAEEIAIFGEEERELLVSRARPIVLAAARVDAVRERVARSVAPRHRELGIMLPYSPLHYLLLRDIGQALVMTSGNLSDEPLAFDDADALARLGEIADAFLVHNRAIERPVDDSVVRVVGVGEQRQRMTVRRSRGYVPSALPLPSTLKASTLACGAQLKNTYAIGVEQSAWLGPHLGDLDGFDTYEAYRAGIARDEVSFGVEIERITCDAHPNYQSTQYGRERAALEDHAVCDVQHHHAHFAAALAERGEHGEAIGVIFDGTGLGDPEQGGGIWGGEIVVGHAASSRRVAHLSPVPLPGADTAVREPWRMACAWLSAADPARADEVPRALRSSVQRDEWARVRRLCERHAGTSVAPWTTSIGRLFDAIAALCGIAPRVSYEGQAAVELEALADHACDNRYDIPIVENAHSSKMMFDGRVLVRAVVDDLERGV